MQWIKAEKDTVMKHRYYPQLDKKNLVPQGYIAEKSGHSRGSTLDLSLVYLDGEKKGQEVDMGGVSSPKGYHGTASTPKSSAIIKRILGRWGFDVGVSSVGSQGCSMTSVEGSVISWAELYFKLT